jgi:hypothetical protein
MQVQLKKQSKTRKCPRVGDAGFVCVVGSRGKASAINSFHFTKNWSNIWNFNRVRHFVDRATCSLLFCFVENTILLFF